MKRSEMVKLVAEHVKPILNDDLTIESGLTSYGAELLVDIVLKALEERGVMPPEQFNACCNDPECCGEVGRSFGWDNE